MNRALKKYFFLLSILLLNGYANGYSRSLSAVPGSFSVSKFEASDNSPCEVEEELGPIVVADTSIFEVQKPLIAEVADVEEEEEESDEVLFLSNKNLVYGGFATAVFYTQSSGHFSNEIENDSDYFKPHTFAAPYKRYIRFQVFRI